MMLLSFKTEVRDHRCLIDVLFRHTSSSVFLLFALSTEVINSFLAKRLVRQQADLERKHWISQVSSQATQQKGEEGLTPVEA